MNDLNDQPTSAAPGSLMDRLKYLWPLILIAVLFLVEQWPVFVNWWGVWEEKEGYYSHGILVPFITAFMLWINRGKFAQAKIRPCWAGLTLLVASLPVYAVGLLMELRLFLGAAFFMCVFGIVLTVFGKQVTRIACMPILFMSTMVPLASSVLDTLTFRAQLISTTVATKFLQFAFPDYGVDQVGNQISSSSLPGGVLLVGVPCSGLRLLISLITFTWFFAYVIRGAWWKKAILMALSFPLAVFINSLRISLIGCVGFWTESSASMHAFHDYSGYIGLLICFVILFGVAKLLRTGDLYTGEPVDPAVGARKPYGSKAAVMVVAGVLVVGILISSVSQPLYNLPKGRLDRASVPEAFGSWTSRDRPIDEQSQSALAKGDLLYREFTDREDEFRQVQVFMTAGLDNSAFHDPHLCLPGGGTPLAADEFITIEFDKPRPITVKATMLTASGNFGSHLFIYWYMLGEESFPRTGDMFSDVRRRKMGDFRKLVTNPLSTPDVRSDILSRQYTWYRFSTSAYGESDKEILIEFIKDFVANTRNFGE